jgi:hypothetical protein
MMTASAVSWGMATTSCGTGGALHERVPRWVTGMRPLADCDQVFVG